MRQELLVGLGPGRAGEVGGRGGAEYRAEP